MKPEAASITRASKSNLALAFISLGKERRHDMTVFYAFCRVIDDIADAGGIEVEVKRVRLTGWRQWLRQPAPDEPPLAGELRAVTAKYSIPPEMLDEIVAGVEMDLTTSRYQTFDDLRVYCYRVASAVGLVSIEIFGYRNPVTRQYAIELGLALQTTNIIRDVGRDLKSGRIYLPEEDLARFGYTEADLQARVYDDRFLRLMKFEATRAHGFFDKAADLLPREDRRSMVAAEIMASVYRALLKRIETDNFQVFSKEYRLSKLQKAGRVAGQLLKFF